VDANQALAAAFRVQGIPAVKAFRDGRVVSEFVGAQPEDVVRRFLEPLLPSEADDEAEAGRAADEAGDPTVAEAKYRRALELEPSHPVAAVGLARMLLDAGDPDRARDLLARVAPSAESRALQARLALQEAAEADQPGLREMAAEAAAGDHRRALELGMELVADGDREGARELVVRIFETLGDDHPLTREFRPRLARALF
jgi:putative thioredoxin